MVRVTLEFSQESAERLNALKAKCGAEDWVEVIRNALRLYEAIVADTEAGHRWLTKTPDGGIQPYKMFE